MKLTALFEQDHRSLLKQWIGAGTSFGEDPDDEGADIENVQQALERRIQDFSNSAVYKQYRVGEHDYEIQDVPISKLQLTHQVEDRVSPDSMEFMAREMKKPQYSQLMRKHDVLPILLGSDFSVLDGYHRHAANALNGSSVVPALVPVSKGTGKVLNVDAYASE